MTLDLADPCSNDQEPAYSEVQLAIENQRKLLKIKKICSKNQMHSGLSELNGNKEN